MNQKTQQSNQDTRSRVRVHGCEVNIVHHCNLTCRGCTHFSPILEPFCVDPEVLYAELTAAHRLLEVDTLILIGGEPLLHPELESVIAACQAAAIAAQLRLVTNALLSHKLTEPVWSALGELFVSEYPGQPLAPPQRQRLIDEAEAHGVLLRFAQYSHFREPYAEIAATSEELVKRVYGSCEIVRHWQCRTLERGVFYKCPQAALIPYVHARPQENCARDGIALLDHTATIEQLEAYLADDKPLNACSFCLGSAGVRFPHELISAADWRELQRRPYAELIDPEAFAEFERHGPSAGKNYRRIEFGKPISPPPRWPVSKT